MLITIRQIDYFCLTKNAYLPVYDFLLSTYCQHRKTALGAAYLTHVKHALPSAAVEINLLYHS
jgi:hypothetical protein